MTIFDPCILPSIRYMPMSKHASICFLDASSCISSLLFLILVVVVYIIIYSLLD